MAVERLKKKFKKKIKKKIKVDLLIPPLVVQKNDVFSSGIPFVSMEIPSIAAVLRERGNAVRVIDAFGEKVNEFNDFDEHFMLRGMTADEAASEIDGDARALIVSCNSTVVSNYAIPFEFVREVIQKAKRAAPNLKVIAVGNFATAEPRAMLAAGADYVLLAEYEESAPQLVDALPFPAVDLLPLENYWSLGYAHAPVKASARGKYLNIQTSRGCPFACEFCFVPSVWQRKWRPRSARIVVDEIAYYVKRFGVTDFHVEDHNPTVDKQRLKEICRELLRRGLRVTLKIAAGSKAETFDDETLALMARAGFVYVSISPETGSPRLLKKMNKPFDYDYALARVKRMHSLGIKTQACFVLGFPGEMREDRRATEAYVKKLARAGIDELSLPIFSPVPGSAESRKPAIEKPRKFEHQGFSPFWRKDYAAVNAFRKKLYLEFFVWRLVFHPLASLRSVVNVFTRNFETKTEMTVYRVIHTRLKKS
jgi:radical SAM superfamily enzyme YgiQ (UPF0313 family)